MLSAIILHDTFKLGVDGSKHTDARHPIIAANFIMHMKQDSISEEEVEIIADCISTHMGQWNTDYKTREEVLDKPSNDMQSFVHLCDYLASRKLIEINFNVKG